MRKIFATLTVLVSFTLSSQIINFPDANFKAKLLQPGVAWDYMTETGVIIDANNDGEIEVSELQSVSNLYISNANITDLTGISYFTNLKFLNCSHNALQNIVIDSAITLVQLDASYNQLTALDVHYDYSGEIDYPIVDLSYNNFTTFTLASGTYEYLNLSYNQLNTLTLASSARSLNASHNPLTVLDLNGSYTKNLDVSFTSLSTITGTGGFKQANFQNCQFTLLDLTNVSFYSQGNGSRIFLGNNLVDKVIFGASRPGNLTYSSTNSSFDLTNFRGSNYCRYHWQDEAEGNVRIIDCPNLNFLSMKNGFNYSNINCLEPASQEAWTQSTLSLEIVNCPNLSFMCVDEGEQDHIQEKINSMGLQNQVQVNSYCSFVPGGTFYTINGNSKFDENSNGCDMTDAAIPNFKFSIANGNNTGEIISNASGNYTMPLAFGTYNITPLLENAAYFNVSPATLTAVFPNDVSPFTQNFCITPNGIHNDLEVKVIPADNARPGFDSSYKISYKNKGTQSQSGTISFTFDDAVLDFVNANPTVSSQATNALNWSFTALQPFETREITVTLNVNSPMEVPPVNGGDMLSFTASINSSLTDETPTDNLFNLNQTVVNSFDPNDKTCLEGSTITPEMVGKEVHYMIRFENTGTANAENIVVKDMIDTAKFDINSLIPIDGSHPFVTRISNTNKVEFLFENIQLPFDDANNDGYVAFKVKTKPTLVVGNSFSNTASIYFDYNFPIITNTATTTVALLANQDFEFGEYFKIYPNPAKDVLNIEMKQTIEVTSINIYNTLGQIVLVIPNAQQTHSVDVSSLKSGNYFMKINSDKGSSSVKFVKM